MDDRPDRSTPLPLPDRTVDGPGRADRSGVLDVVVVAGDGRGPAVARNIGWRRSTTPWVAFLDDDVSPGEGWLDRLMEDLEAAPTEVGAIQGRIEVPLPSTRRPTDWERNVAGLEGARWVTADMAVRREALLLTGGFDERFRRAYREDIDLALRLSDGRVAARCSGSGSSATPSGRRRDG